MKKLAVSVLLLAMVGIFWGCPSAPDEKDVAMEEVRESSWEPMRAVAGEELEQAEIDALLARLPPLVADEADQVSFKRREASMAPPLSGDDVDGDWPPDLSSPVAQATPEGPLRVQAFRPEGEVDPPFQAAIAFDRPVVELAAVGTHDTERFSITPEIEGRWRWIGTQTVVFEPEEAWPMATEFSIGVSDDLEAVDGKGLAGEVRFAFSTPGPRVQTVYPQHGPQARDAAVIVVFNQPIDQASAEAISVYQGRTQVPMEVLEGEALRQEAKERHLESVLDEGRLIAMAPRQPYEMGQSATIRIEGPLKSAQGPVIEQASHRSTFNVHGPLQLRFMECGWGHDCRPGSPIRILMTNPVDATDGEIDIDVDPPVEALALESTRGQDLWLRGDFQPRTTYTITLPADLTDVFGETIQGGRSAQIEVGSHHPFVAGPNQRLLVRPAHGEPAIPFRVAELESMRVRLFRADPEQWSEFVKWQSHGADGPSGRPVRETTVRFDESKRHQPMEHAVNYAAALGDGGRGHAVIVVDRPQPWPNQYHAPRWIYWVQHTDLAADITTDSRELALNITSLGRGNAVGGAAIKFGDRSMARTDSTGSATVDLSASFRHTDPLVVESGDDTLLIPPQGQTHWFNQHQRWQYQAPQTNLLWYVVDDRQMYKPGEEVKIRGWVRQLERSPKSDLVGLGQGGTIEYSVLEPRRNEIASGTVSTDSFGGFEFSFSVPDNANLGTATIHLAIDQEGIAAHNRRTAHHVQFQEFRRPEYEVTMSTDEGPHRVAEETTWEVEAAYYAGGAVGGAPVYWRFDESEATYRPTGWSGWTFGRWTPWWSPWSGRGVSGSTFEVVPDQLRNFSGHQTGADGKDRVKMVFESPERGFARRVSGTASVTDVNRQTWEATDAVLVHPAEVYVGLRSEKNFIPRDEAWEVDLVVVDVDGEVVEGRPVQVQLQHRRTWNTFEDVDDCEQISSAEHLNCSFDELVPGSYRVVAKVTDEQGRVSETETNFWVAGQDRSGAETAEEDELIIIPEQEEFAVGDKARLFVQAPYYPLDVVVELRRDGRYERREVRLSANDPVVEIDIEEAMIPNVHVRVLALGSDEGYGVDHFAAGSINLQVDRGPRKLGVTVEPRTSVIAPGDDLTTSVRVVDAEGAPVKDAQVLLFAVDESVLALSAYELADPLSVFYRARAAGMSDIRSRAWLLLDGEEELEAEEAVIDEVQQAPMGALGASGARGSAPAPMMARMESAPAEMDAAFGAADMGGGGAQEAIALREVFDALAFFRSDGVTDEDGEVSFTQTMPDSLTRYRVMAVAVAGDKFFGSGQEDVTARRPLMVRPSAPRFLNVGDSFDLPVVIHNRSDRERTVKVALRATSALEWIETPGRAVKVPADDRVEVRFAARVTSAGTTRIQVGVADDEYADAELVTLPVLTPATTEAFATYGSIGDGDADALLQALKVPDDAYSEFGGLEVMTSSTQMQSLTDAFIYLTSYPFECSEQLASRILSVLALYDVLDAFEAEGLPDEEALKAAMAGWISDLEALQRSDGGFGFWSGSRLSSPYTSTHATLALWKAQQAGYEVASYRLQRAQNYLRNVANYIHQYHPRAAAAVEAYALHVRHRMGQASARELDQYVTRRGIEEMPMEALGWLLPMAQGTQFEQRFLQRITNQVQETAATAEFQETYESDAYRILHTTRRTDGVVLAGLIAVDPDHYLIEKVARGLMAHRTRGRWGNTQENVFILKALRAYFDAYEEVEPDFVARAWLGEDHIAEHEFKGRTTERHHVEVPMSFLAAQGEENLPLVMQRDGAGRMYYRLGIRYAPRSRMLPAHNEGFTVERTYEAVDDPDDVVRTDQGWEIRAGARVRVALTMTIPARRYHVALVDWLPAGFEPVNTALAVSDVESDLVGGSTDRRQWYWWWSRPWFEHQNMRDERVEAFASLVSEGVHTYSYVARATTPGEFIAMPAKAEEMYHPETFGRSASEIVRVVDP